MKVFLTIILLAIFTTEFLNFCTNALIWVNLDRKERENEKHIDGKKVIKVQNGHISIAFPTGIEKTGRSFGYITWICQFDFFDIQNPSQ